MANYKLWMQDLQEDARAVLIPAGEVEQVVMPGEGAWIFSDGADRAVEALQGAYDASVGEYDFRTFDGVLEWYETHFDSSYVDRAELTEKPDDRIALIDGTFYRLSDLETFPVYRWWDGSNWKTEYLSEGTLTDVEVDTSLGCDCVSLDEWDGHNFVTGGTGRHQKVYALDTVDGESTNDYLLVYSSQWQGDHDCAEIMTFDELKEHVASLENRDVDAYMDSIAQLK